MVLRRVLYTILTGLFIVTLFPRCAKVVSPTGGPKDTIAPVMVNSVPKFNATNYKGNQITFEFNEYIQLKEYQQKLIISPPLSKTPFVKTKGKKIIIETTDTLKENTTYTVYLGDAISDINEGNPINSFEFAFSTGDMIDTLTLKGSVVNSFTQKPVEGALLMLYDSFSDSLPYKELPKHIAKTNKSGEFKLNNLKHLDYKLVCITDANSNYKYNQGVEDIGFYSDTLKRDRLIDTASTNKVTIRTFREELPHQIITGYDRPERNQFILGFSRKPVGGFSLENLNIPEITNWYVTEPDLQGDTVKVWIINDTLATIDTLKVLARYQKTDSLNILNPQTDTLKVLFFEKSPEPKRSKSKKGETEEKEGSEIPLGFKITTTISGTVFPSVPFDFTTPVPIKKIDSSKIKILNETDSIIEPQVNLYRDSINPRIFYFNKDWKPLVSYKMLVLPGAFEDYSAHQNDTLRIQFKGADPEDFGTLIIKPNGVNNGVVVELLNDKGKVVTSKSSIGNKTITFTFVQPGKYRLRFIEDLNENSVWDSGNYLKRIQPERVFEFTEGKYKGEINIRANWENEISYTIPKP